MRGIEMLRVGVMRSHRFMCKEDLQSVKGKYFCKQKFYKKVLCETIDIIMVIAT